LLVLVVASTACSGDRAVAGGPGRMDGGPGDSDPIDGGSEAVAHDGGVESCPSPVSGSGLCLHDSECPAGSYCDFALALCASDHDAGLLFGSFTEIAGRCLLPCGTTGSTCRIPEDCPVNAWCEETTVLADGGDGCSGQCGVACSDEAPCTSGQCVASAITACPADPCSGEGCGLERAPHEPLECAVCICQGCAVTPDAG